MVGHEVLACQVRVAMLTQFLALGKQLERLRRMVDVQEYARFVLHLHGNHTPGNITFGHMAHQGGKRLCIGLTRSLAEGGHGSGVEALCITGPEEPLHILLGP